MTTPAMPAVLRALRGEGVPEIPEPYAGKLARTGEKLRALPAQVAVAIVEAETTEGAETILRAAFEKALVELEPGGPNGKA